MDPLYELMENAPRYIRVIYQKKVRVEQKKYGASKIVWSTAAKVGKMTLASNLKIILGNKKPSELLGANLMQCYFSELAFFLEATSTTEDEIYELYSNAIARINATVGNKYLSFAYLDTSANLADSKIEKHIINDLQYDKNTYFTWRNQWETQKGKLCPEWWKEYSKLTSDHPLLTEKDKEELLYEKNLMFKVITGNGSIQPKLIVDENELKDVPPNLIQYVPIDLKSQYELNLVKNIKDIGGKPTSKESKFIASDHYINRIFTNPHLKNIDGNLVADSKEETKRLLWDQVKDIFFLKHDKDKYFFHRAPHEARFIGLDASTANKGDPFGFTMLHKEYSQAKQSEIYVADMSFIILPKKAGINLAAVEEFILELNQIGNINLESVSGDTHYIQSIKQRVMDRGNIPVISQSVDTDLNKYQYFYTCLLQNKILTGKNIFLKNNLRCLERVKNSKGIETVDHPKGKVEHTYLGDWDKSSCGLNEKDCSDSFVQAFWSADQSKIVPATIYEEEEKKFSKKDDDQHKILLDNYKKLMSLYI
jgi:hypothetical protein